MTTPFDHTLTRRSFVGALGATTALTVLPGCAASQTAQIEPVTTMMTPPAGQAAGEALLQEFAWNLLEHEPTRASSLGVDTGERAALRSRLHDATQAGQDAYAATLQRDLERARQFPKVGLDATTRTSFAVVESAYATAVEGFALPYGDIPVGSWRTAPYPVIQNVGAYIDLPRALDSDHPIRTEEDAEAYLSRLEAIPDVLAGELERMQAGRTMGVIPPDFLLTRADDQMERQLRDAMAGGSLVESLVRRTAEAGIAGDWQARAEAIVTGPVAMRLENQLAELRLQRGMAGSAPGMAAQPEGDEWYRWSLKSSTTTTMSPAEIHELGIDTLADIHAEMDPILRSLGYTEGNPGQRMIELSQDDRFKFAEGDEGRAQIIDFLEERIEWIRGEMPRAFRRVVNPAVQVRRIPPNEELGAPTAYGGAPAVDGSRPGTFWINLRTTDLHRAYDLVTLTHHEAIPGHVWEGEYSNQLPLIRAILAFNAFSEGWALYSEQLADELGAYADNPAWRLGYLQAAAYRAIRLVVDTGLHAQGWGRQQAIDYFHTNSGVDIPETTNEIDRYCSWPGQACGYMVGKLEILRQRSRAQRVLGSAYDLRDFNMAVVEGGNAPLDVMGQNVSRYMIANGAQISAG
ncbi:DUF885 domain-containing protein [Erythrobacter sp. EC-HK427]|uniref:DUF885 domain-containing protein n=1 Tax=Erythrobacter sp. EC-HK427 TaxID=2038396 RepID=UPI00125C97B6|nr:DUF885 domain-containing protein [Erythrobacter sp. EC-HK427]VVT19712.1 Twin-arginine translocation pathway signal [Erythrobacter sp. EC-HK427]